MNLKMRWSVVFISLVLSLCTRPQIINAGGPCKPNLVSSNQITAQIQLSPKIERKRSGSNQIIHQSSVLVPYKKGMRVRLAGSANGRAPMVTDDAIEVKVENTGVIWAHDFRTGPNKAIESMPPQNLNDLFESDSEKQLEVYEVTFTSRDLLAPEYRSSEYWLVLWTWCVEETPTVEATDTPVVPSSTPTTTSTHTSTPTDTPSPTAAATDTPTLMHTETPTSTPTALPTSTPTATSLSVAPVVSSSSGIPIMIWWVPVGLALGFGGTMLWWRYSQPRTLLTGKLSQNIEGRWERDHDLDVLGLSSITIGKGDGVDIALMHLPYEGVVARVIADATARDAEVQVRVEIMDPLNPELVLESSPLRNGRELTFGPYTLAYQSFQQEKVEDTGQITIPSREEMLFDA